MESTQCKDLLTTPRYPYTQALIRAMPDFDRSLLHKSRLNTLLGAIPPLEHLPISYRLGPRAPMHRRNVLKRRAYVRLKTASSLTISHLTWRGNNVKTLLQVRNLSKTYRYRSGPFRR